MADNFKNTLIIRYDVHDYLEVGGPDSGDFAYLNFGFTEIGENPGAVVEEKAYVGDRSTSSTVKGYRRVFPFTMDVNLTKGGTEIRKIYELEKTGREAERDYIKVNIFEQIQGETNTFFARKFHVSIQVTGTTGAGTEIMTSSGNFNQVGAMVLGKFNTVTKTFTPNEDPDSPEGLQEPLL